MDIIRIIMQTNLLLVMHLKIYGGWEERVEAKDWRRLQHHIKFAIGLMFDTSIELNIT